MFGTGNYATIWNVENKGNYSVVELSTSRKNKETGEYETDFSSKFVRFIGTAHSGAGALTRKSRIKLGNCGVSARYDKEKNKEYVNYCVFSFEGADENDNAHQAKTSAAEVEEEMEELPFE